VARRPAAPAADRRRLRVYVVTPKTEAARRSLTCSKSTRAGCRLYIPRVRTHSGRSARPAVASKLALLPEAS
jgi:hypothetical protein